MEEGHVELAFNLQSAMFNVEVTAPALFGHVQP